MVTGQGSYKMDLNDYTREIGKVSKDNQSWLGNKDELFRTKLLDIILTLSELSKHKEAGILEHQMDRRDPRNVLETVLADGIVDILDIAAAYKLNMDHSVKVSIAKRVED
jgi:hypothetical protein